MPLLTRAIYTLLVEGLRYSHDDGSPATATVRRQLLRAAYLGTLLSAIDLACPTVVLTLIGGGVFANPHADIWHAIHWSLDEAAPSATHPMQILVNARDPLADADRATVRARGGKLVVFGDQRAEVLF